MVFNFNFRNILIAVYHTLAALILSVKYQDIKCHFHVFETRHGLVFYRLNVVLILHLLYNRIILQYWLSCWHLILLLIDNALSIRILKSIFFFILVNVFLFMVFMPFLHFVYFLFINLHFLWLTFICHLAKCIKQRSVIANLFNFFFN